ncbi:MAG: hypothetical protein EHM43_08965, partial [Ignavibacteriae bacterium]
VLVCWCASVLVCWCASVLTLQAGPRLVLVLTGGGARGAAQIGVLKEFDRQGIQPDAIVGTSIGAVIGGLYASGYSGVEIEQIFSTINWDDVLALGDDTKRQSLFFAQKQEEDRSLLDLRFRDFKFLAPQSLGGSARFVAILQDLLWRSPYNTVTDFDHLRCQFRAVATNLVDGTWVSLSHGNLATAIQASASFPLRYAPVRFGDSILVDGGLVANIPVRAAKELGGDLVIVVNSVGDYLPPSDLDDAISVADQALTASMKQLDTAYLREADMVIAPRLAGITTFDFDRVPDCIAAGESAGREMSKTIKNRLRDIQNKQLAENPPPPYDPDAQTAEIMRTIILSVDLRASFDARAIAVVDSLITDVSGRGWSDGFVRHYRVKLNTALHEGGYPLAYVRAMAYDSTKKELTIHIDQGRIHDVLIDPRRPVKLADVRQEFTFPPGSMITTEQLQRTADNLRGSDLFDDVDIAIVPSSDSGIDLIVGAQDRGNQIVRLGARIDNERYTQGSVDLIHQNLFASGVRIGIHGVLSPRIGEISGVLELPRIAGSLWTATLRGYTSFRNVWIYTNAIDAPANRPERDRTAEYSEDRYGARLSAGRQLERNGVILGEFRWEQQRYRDLASATPPDYQPLASLRGIVRWDDRDRIDFATDGRVIDIFFESSVLSLSDGISFTKASALAKTVLGLGGTTTLTPSFLIGAADRTLPGPELFSLGGQDLFFGMREDEERGRQIVVGNLDASVQLPFDVFFDTYLSVRYDIGAIWEVPEKIRIADLQHAYGVTVGIDTPIGPARFSVGQRFYFLDDPASIAWGPLLAYFAIGVRL